MIISFFMVSFSEVDELRSILMKIFSYIFLIKYSRCVATLTILATNLQKTRYGKVRLLAAVSHKDMVLFGDPPSYMNDLGIYFSDLGENFLGHGVQYLWVCLLVNGSGKT